MNVASRSLLNQDVIASRTDERLHMKYRYFDRQTVRVLF